MKQSGIRVGDPALSKVSRGVWGWPFCSFAPLLASSLPAYLLPYAWAPTMWAMRLYMRACLYLSTWSASCLYLHTLCPYSRRLNTRPCTVLPMVCFLLRVWLMVCFLLAVRLRTRRTSGLIFAYRLPIKQAATNRVGCTIARGVIPLHRREKKSLIRCGRGLVEGMLFA